MDIIECSNLNFSYNKKKILNDINFKIKEQDFIGIIGSNGSGKTTLIKLLINQLIPKKGNIKIMGEDVSSFKNWESIGYLSQEASKFSETFVATVEEIVMLNLEKKIGLFKRPKESHKKLVSDALDSVGMLKYKKELITNLSGGETQRVFLAASLVNKPKILILDEPTNSIDLKGEESIYCLLKDLNKKLKITIIIVSHDIPFIMSHVNRLFILKDNTLKEHNLKNKEDIKVIADIFDYDIINHRKKDGE